MVVGNPERPECIKCGLWSQAKRPFLPPVVENTALAADLALVGDAPNEQDEKVGEILRGKPGIVLDKAIDASKFRTANLAFLTAVQCSPGPDQDCSTEQMRCCRPLLLANLKELGAACVVALGTGAVKALVNRGDATLGGAKPHRLKVFEVRDLDPQPRVVSATYHPRETLVVGKVGGHTPPHQDLIRQDLDWVAAVRDSKTTTIPPYGELTPDLLRTLAAVPGVIDIEFDGEGTEIFSIAIHTKAGGYAAVVQHPENLTVDIVSWREALEYWLANCPLIIGHNLSSDLLSLGRFGVRYPEAATISDTLAAARIKWHNDPDRTLESLASAKMGLPDYTTAITPYKRQSKVAFGRLTPAKILLDYNYGDAYATWLLHNAVVPHLPVELYSILMEAEWNLVLTTWDGQYVDRKRAADKMRTLRRRARRWRTKLRAIVGDPNYNYRSESGKQWPFQNLGWAALQTGTSGLPSLDEPLLLLKKQTGRVRSKRFARVLLKLKRAENLLNRLRSDICGRLDKDSLLHAAFNTAGARTMRMSSHGPNFQNLNVELRYPIVSRWGMGDDGGAAKAAV